MKIIDPGLLKKSLVVFGIAWILWMAGAEIYQIASGTGKWYGEFSQLWAMLFFGITCLFILSFVLITLSLFNTQIMEKAVRWISDVRNRLGYGRWILWAIIFISPLVIFQFSVWGIVLQKTYIRVLIWGITLFLLTLLATNDGLFSWPEFLSMFVVTASLFSIGASLQLVNDYPFSLGWSEGNRIWDYSVMFGRDLYDYPHDKYIPVLLDKGRQFIGGLPFLIPGLSITVERLWLGLIQIFPYFLLGIFAFRKLSEDRISWLIISIWTFLFLRQGPIHIPLVLCGALVALAWRSPYWISIPLIILSGYFAQASRFSWVFAPGLWIGMLEFSSASLRNGKVDTATWIRACSLGFFGIFGGFLLPKLMAFINLSGMGNLDIGNMGEALSDSGLTAEGIAHEVTHQPLLWYRLLPNSTYGTGILLGLVLAVGPLLLILLYLLKRNYWKINFWQKISIAGPLLAFFIVGLIASTKIGGGGDLHNMDMFLIGLFFTGVAAFHNGGLAWLKNPDLIPQGIKFVIVLWFILITFDPLIKLRSFQYGEYIPWLRTLTDAPFKSDLEMLPTQDAIDQTLTIIQSEVDKAKLHGDILFIDQRQLLTFGYIQNVPFVPEYEKKLLMNEALSSDQSYFQSFYDDLAAHRFSLIISEPLRSPIKDSSYEFGEENNAWVTWVSIPVLCYYEPLETLKEVKVQLLIPQAEPNNCLELLP